ncbi:hypothetical protein Tco_0038920 [Tanacetum coccineum]
MEILLEPTSNKLLVGLDDGVAASFQRSRIHKPHAHTHAFKVNRSTSRSLILNFPTIKEPQSDGASWSTIVEEGELVDAAGSRATTSAIGAITSRESFHEVRVLNCCVQKPLPLAHQNLHELSQ